MSRIIALNDANRPRHLQKKTVIESEHKAYLEGEFYAEAFQCREMMDGRSIEIPGTRRVLFAPTHNLLLDNALEAYGRPLDDPGTLFNLQFNTVHVGTGSTVESTTDTALETYVASAAMGTRNTSTNYAYASGVVPYWGARRARARFDPNFAGGSVNLSEMGVSDYGSVRSDGNTNGYLTGRALIRDSNGDPTTVSVLASEYLDVWYTRRLYPGHIIEGTGAPNDGTGTIDIDGTSYNYTIRPGLVTSSSYWGYDVDYPFHFSRSVSNNFTEGNWYRHPATLGAVTSQPAGYLGDDDGMFYTSNHRLQNYVPYTYNRTAIYSTELSTAAWAEGIGAVEMQTRMGTYQCLLSAGIPKTSSNILEWYCNFSWARKVL